MLIRVTASLSVLASVSVLARTAHASFVIGPTVEKSSLEGVRIRESEAAVMRTLGKPTHIRRNESIGIANYVWYTYRRLGLEVIFHGTQSGTHSLPAAAVVPFRVESIVSRSRALKVFGLHVGSTVTAARAKGFRCVGGPESVTVWRCQKVIGPPFVSSPTPHHSRDTLVEFVGTAGPEGRPSSTFGSISLGEYVANNEEGSLEAAPGFV
jgi:hypothetical protein